MRNVAVGLVTLLFMVGCSGEVTTESVNVQADVPEVSAVVVDGSNDAPEDVVVSTPAPEQAETVVEEPAATESEPANDGLFPIVVEAVASPRDGDTWNVDVTLSSEYDSAARYADAWRVLDADDNELGIRVLTHDHANEQPFTRSASVEISPDVATVFIEGRDQLNGWSGERFELTLNR